MNTCRLADSANMQRTRTRSLRFGVYEEILFYNLAFRPSNKVHFTDLVILIASLFLTDMSLCH